MGRLHLPAAQRVAHPLARAGEPIRDPRPGRERDPMGPWGQNGPSSVSVDANEACPRPLADELRSISTKIMKFNEKLVRF